MLGFLKNVLGGGAGSREPESADPVEHEGFTIVATPRKASGGWSTEGRIGKVVGGEAKGRPLHSRRHVDVARSRGHPVHQ